MKAIILAAGRGSRMGELSEDSPKCLVEVCGRTLLSWQIAALHGAGIEDIGLITERKVGSFGAAGGGE